MTDASLAALLLTNRITPVDAKPFRASEFWPLADAVGPLDELFGLTVDQLQSTKQLSPELAVRVATLLDAASAFASVREQLESSGIELVAASDDRYPDRLRRVLGGGAPPMLYMSGPVDWLGLGGVGVVGSAEVGSDRESVAAAVAVVSEASGAGMAVISGAASGFDQMAMSTALNLGTPVVGVTAEGLRRVSRSKDVRTPVSEGRLCVATPYPPDAEFSAANASGRSKILYALADVTVVVTCSDDDETWAGATEALQHHYGQVAVWHGPGEGTGNAAVEAEGAIPITTAAEAIALAPD